MPSAVCSVLGTRYEKNRWPCYDMFLLSPSPCPSFSSLFLLVLFRLTIARFGETDYIPVTMNIRNDILA